ncbi:hypothetical protein [Caulobacter sp. DWR1-3-2b1]|uniref:hypothetical protein n=1 Tax=Caulobacter sp. DWR1-3-2b1 TaxID=2804670 RepID=UPI003CF80F24
MGEAQKRALAPFEGELRAIGLALGAIERAGLSEDRVAAEPSSFAIPAPSRRGRRSRSIGDMILMALQHGGAGLAVTDIALQLERRWNRSLPVTAITLELQQLEADGAVTRGLAGWTRTAETVDPDHPEDSEVAQVA